MMRPRSWLFLTAAVVCIMTSEVWAQSAVGWQRTLESAKRVAGQTNRLVLIHFWAEYCGACKQMDQDVFSRRDVAAAIEAGYVPVKLNAEHFPATARQYQVTALPTAIILTPQGDVIERLQGAVRPEHFVARLNQIAANTTRRGQGVYAQIASTPPPENAAQAEPRVDAADDPRSAHGRPGTSQGTNDRYADYFNRRQQTQVASVSPRYGAEATARQQTPPPGANPSSPPVTYSPPSQTSLPSGRSPGAYGNPTSQPPGTTATNDRPRAVEPSRVQLGAPPPTPGTAGPPAMARPSTQTQSAAQPPTGNPPPGLDGFCPVELLDRNRWQRGDPRWGIVHRGRTYLFAGPQQKQEFWADPDRYAPVMSGNDVVMAVNRGQFVPGRREFGGRFRNRVYLFASEESYQEFKANADRYVEALLQSSRTTAGPMRR